MVTHFLVKRPGDAFGGTPKAAGGDARAPQSNCLVPAKTLLLLFLMAAVGTGVFIAGCSKERGDGAVTTANESKTLYTCGMHPQVIQDHPGNCPICGMKLTPIRKEASLDNTNSIASARPDQSAVGESQAITIDSATMQNMDIRTATVSRGPLRRIVRTVGVVDYNETTLGDVTTKFKGWIEKLDVNATGQLVMRGDPLFEIYSPDLYSAQVEYLLATSSPSNATPGAEEIRISALTKLKFFDISDGQIAELEKMRQPRKTLRILAPQDGFVVEKNVTEGQMVDAGMRIYKLADLGLVWVQADIYEQDLAYIKLGQEASVTLSYLPDREFRGRVTYIYPNVDEKTRTARVRMEFHNPGYFLKPGMFATVKIVSELEPSVLLVPDMAILRSGDKATVFVALEGGRFAPRTVTLGPEAEDDEYQVLSGVSEGERIVTSGQFMLDSESQLREAIQKMLKPNKASGPPANEVASARNATKASPSATPETVKYICPMPEHVSIEYDHPGKCPICGMTLVPVSQAMLKNLLPGGKILFYTCPMPEDREVRSDKPGKCPKCGMTLIPIFAAPPLPPPAADLTNNPSSSATPAGSMTMPDGTIMPGHAH
ncbi:MAG: efflux RND transporter periplasmic adaptor subunit [Limisphaerales bacterium]